MTEKKYTQKDMDDALAKLKKEAEEQKPAEPEAAKPAEEKADAPKVDEEQKKSIAALQKEVKELKEHAILKATVEGPEAGKAVKKDVDATVETLLKARYGVKQE